MKKTINFEGKQIAFFQTGRGGKLPLVLLHGFCEDATIWEEILPKIKGKIVRIDLPGFGGSDVSETPGIEKYADATAAVLDFLKFEKSILVGHSMGGYAALAFAKKYPQRLAALGLLHSHPFPDSETAIENRRRGIEMLKSGKKNQYVAQLFPGLFPKEFAEAKPDILKRLIARAQKFPTEGIIQGLENMMTRPDHRKTLTAVACPVLFIVGKKDNLISPENAQEMTAMPEVADIHFLENCGHMGMLEMPERVGELVENFARFVSA